jgi:hypothetical protein
VVTTTVGVVSVAVLAVGAASPPPPQPARLIRAALAMANDIHLNCVFMSMSPDKSESETWGKLNMPFVAMKSNLLLDFSHPHM